MFLFYTPWKHQETEGFLMLPGGYRSEKTVENGFKHFKTFLLYQIITPHRLILGS